eukprot:999263-Pelagomonas_calceolata.AAC.1
MSLAYAWKTLSTTIYKPFTPNEFDHRPLPGQQSVPCVRAANTAEETKQQFLDTHHLRGKKPQIYLSCNFQRQPQQERLMKASDEKFSVFCMQFRSDSQLFKTEQIASA